MKGKGRGRPNGHVGSYKKQGRRRRALDRLTERIASVKPLFKGYDAWLAFSQAEAAALRKLLGTN